jgi:hypothetical protein
MSKQEMATGHRHIEVIMRLGRLTVAQTSLLLADGLDKNVFDMVESIGTSLSALYQAATCHRRCFGGDHIVESLCGRAYNVGSGAYHLLALGLYDESLALIRSLGELTNLVAAMVVDQTMMATWSKSDKRARRKEFSPVAVRRYLKENHSPILYATDEWYGDFSETYIHVSPHVKPNSHSGRQSVAGGVFQKDGVIKSLTERFDTRTHRRGEEAA